MFKIKISLVAVCLLGNAMAGLQHPGDVHANPSANIPAAQELANLPPDGGPNFNRLVFESSPYLQQHATNPVDWYPWGAAAFSKARQEDKPIFLSIGYSTCHWCHVMERESYADPEVGRLMNQFFIAIKVDREERPDLDHLYMRVCARMSQHCGWPLNVILTPDLKPFFVVTYLPREDRQGRAGMLRLLPSIDRVWKTRRDDILSLADRVLAALTAAPSTARGKPLARAALERTFDQLQSLYDTSHGGIGGPPKFPKPLALSFLLRYWRRTGNPQALAMVETTLQHMRRGGIYDHIGFGFHRYATDVEWRVPHFEKMLYNQALLLILYSEAYQITGKPLYAQTAREIATYVQRDMTSPEGGFYTAEDADSAGEEGVFYLWTTAEIRRILGPGEAELYQQVFNLAADGNFPQADARQYNIPYLQQDLSDLAATLHVSEATLAQRLETARQRLFAERKKRQQPLKDDKILTDWNGLMIAAFAKAGQLFDRPDYLAAAQRAADFVLQHLRNAEGRLLKRYRQGKAGLPAHIDDYAYMIWGLLDLYEATFKVDYLQTAIDLQHKMLTYFWDHQHAGFFYTANDQVQVLLRSKDVQDVSLPSGNSVAVMNLLRLYRMTGDTVFARKADASLQAFASQVERNPSAHTHVMSAVDFALGPSYEVVISGTPDRPDTRVMLNALRQPFVPNKVVVFRPADVASPAIAQLAPYTRNQTPLNGQATAYVCQHYVCNAPTTDIQTMLQALSAATRKQEATPP